MHLVSTPGQYTPAGSCGLGALAPAGSVGSGLENFTGFFG